MSGQQSCLPGQCSKWVPGEGGLSGCGAWRLIQQATKSVKERDWPNGWDIKVGMWEPCSHWEGESLPVPDRSLSPEQKLGNNA